MSRLEEVNKSMKDLDNTIYELKKYALNDEKIINMELASIVTVLRDISVTMAILVDRLAESEAEE